MRGKTLIKKLLAFFVLFAMVINVLSAGVSAAQNGLPNYKEFLVTNEEELLAALDYAEMNPGFSIDIRITASMVSPNRTITIWANTRFIIEKNVKYVVKQQSEIDNYGEIHLYGTLNHNGRIFNKGNGKGIAYSGSKIEGNDKWVNEGEIIAPPEYWFITFDADGGVLGNGRGFDMQYIEKTGKNGWLLIEPNPIPVKEGFVFEYWHRDGADGEWNFATQVNTVLDKNDYGFTLIAKWKKIESMWTTVTFVSEDESKGSLTGTLVFSGIIGESTSLINEPGKAPKNGYDFDYWDREIPGEYQDSDIVITAIWKAIEVDMIVVTFDKNSDDPDISGPTPASSIVKLNVPYGALAAISRPGYTFGGWFTTAACLPDDLVTETSAVKNANNHILYVRWIPKSDINVTFDKNADDSGVEGPTPVNIKVTYDAPYGKLAEINREGYEFIGWYTTAKTGGTKITDDSIVTNVENHTLYARWIENDEILVTFNENGGNTLNTKSKRVTLNDVYGTLATTGRTGYTFNGWFTEAAGGTQVTSSTTVTNAANHTLYAHWTVWNDIVVTFNANGGSAPNPRTKTVTFDSAYGTLASTERANAGFLGWYTSASGGTQVTSSTVVSNANNHTLYAHWNTTADVPPGGGVPGGGTPTPTPRPSPSPVNNVTRATSTPARPPTSSPPPVTISDDNTPAGAAIFNTDHMSYIMGYDDNTVRPERAVTRAEVATVFYRLLSDDMRKENWTLVNAFSDVSSDSWYNAAISVIANLDVIRGYPDGTFRPDALITRAELASIAARFARVLHVNGNNNVSFIDIAEHWAEPDINYSAVIGWINGYPDRTFKPDQSITRAEFITLVNNMLERKPENIHDLLIEQMVIYADNVNSNAWYYIDIQEATNSHHFVYKDGQNIPGKLFKYERWTNMTENPDWMLLEQQWIEEYSQ